MDKKPIKTINSMSKMTIRDAEIAEQEIAKLVLRDVDAFVDEEHMRYLFRSYMQKLIDDGRMLRLSQIKDMDILDTTEFLPLPNNDYGAPSVSEANEEEKEVLSRLGWYAGIPCFEKGALKINKFRYIVFEVLEIDPEEKRARIKVRDYLKCEDQVWQMGVGATFIINKDEKGREHRYKTNIESCETFTDLYTLYSAKDLHWPKSDYKLWNDTVVKHAQISNELMYNETGGLNHCECLINMFILIIARCNAMLEMNKPTKPVKMESPKGTGAKRKTVYEKDAEPQQKTRYVGSLRIRSHNVPKKPCYETVVTYKVAKWNVRGHVRHYKSGKDVYIKPSTRTRKALEDSKKTTATTIRFRKRKE